MSEKYEFVLIDQNPSDENWDGKPTTLLVNQNLKMSQTPNGTTVFAGTNLSTLNNLGELAMTSGGGAPEFYKYDAHANQPGIKINNWEANNLSITNVSANNDTPIQVQLVGPGIPGITPVDLPVGKPVKLSTGQVAQGNALPQYMQLVIQSTSATLGIIAFIGGPQDASGNNGYVVAVNHPTNTGPGTGKEPPEGYYATTTSNTYTYSFNWGSSLVFTANMSPSTASDVSITMRQL